MNIPNRTIPAATAIRLQVLLIKLNLANRDQAIHDFSADGQRLVDEFEVAGKSIWAACETSRLPLNERNRFPQDSTDCNQTVDGVQIAEILHPHAGQYFPYVSKPEKFSISVRAVVRRYLAVRRQPEYPHFNNQVDSLFDNFENELEVVQSSPLFALDFRLFGMAELHSSDPVCPKDCDDGADGLNPCSQCLVIFDPVTDRFHSDSHCQNGIVA
jgi:hypothetical protein